MFFSFSEFCYKYEFDCEYNFLAFSKNSNVDYKIFNNSHSKHSNPEDGTCKIWPRTINDFENFYEEFCHTKKLTVLLVKLVYTQI